MSELSSSLRNELINTKDDKEYRHAYADENLNATIATQIKVLREQRDWKQEDLAEEAGMKQPMISRYENVNYSSWSISTLKKLAAAYDVYLDVRFRSFQTLVEIADEFGRNTLEVPPFTEDPFFHEASEVSEDTLKENSTLGDLASAVPQILKEQTQETPLCLFLETLNPNISPAEQATNLSSSKGLSTVLTPATGSLSAAGKAPIGVQVPKESAEEFLRPKKAA
jgi:transcriptional regulator with XRE-family HTH domain